MFTYNHLISELRTTPIDMRCARIMREAADAIEEFNKIIPHNCFCCVGCELEPEDVHGCDIGFVLSANRAKQYIDELLSKQEITHWISVEERLPEEFVNVLVANKRGNRYDIDKAWWNGSSFDRCAKGAYGNVTHWMPLPEPPKK